MVKCLGQGCGASRAVGDHYADDTAANFVDVSVADFIDYFFQFADQGSAQRDPIVGPLMVRSNEAIIFNGFTNSVDALGGYTVVISQVGDIDPVLTGHPDLLLVNDVSLFNQGLPSVLFSDLAPVPGLIIIFNPFSPYAIQTLRLGPQIARGDVYITEAGDPYVTEDGASFYVTESSP